MEINRMNWVSEIYAKLDTETLLSILEAEANRVTDGHYTIMKFTTSFKVVFGTPDLHTGMDYERIWLQGGQPSLREAIIDTLVSRKSVQYGAVQRMLIQHAAGSCHTDV